MKKTAIILVLLGLAASRTAAGVIPLGIDWRKNIYVQEFWRDDVPTYAIANLSKEPATISIFQQQGNKLLAGPWVILPQTTVTKEVRALLGSEMITFKLGDGSPLGLMPAPIKAAIVKGTLVSYDGLNGSGGRQTTLWVEQPSESVAAGAIFSVTLKVPEKSGLVRWSQKASTNGPLSQLALIEAASDTLPIAKKGDEIEIDTGKATKQNAIHSVTLRFRAPVVDAPTMVMISGNRTLPGGGGHGITRGILVSPEKGKK